MRCPSQCGRAVRLRYIDIDMLFEHGRTAAEAWLKTGLKHVGVKSTVDVRKMFQGEDVSALVPAFY